MTKTKNLFKFHLFSKTYYFSKKNFNITIPRTIGDFLNDFGGWKMKIILVILYWILVKNH